MPNSNTSPPLVGSVSTCPIVKGDPADSTATSILQLISDIASSSDLSFELMI